MNTFQRKVKAELARARRKHPVKFHSAHEGFAILWEEVHEVWDEVRAQRHDPVAMRAELVQVAAMAQRMAEDLKLV